ncbi:MAG: hypothetical protein ACP5LI_07925 [Hydrogenobaculum sp.]
MKVETLFTKAVKKDAKSLLRNGKLVSGYNYTDLEKQYLEYFAYYSLSQNLTRTILELSNQIDSALLDDIDAGKIVFTDTNQKDYKKIIRIIRAILAFELIANETKEIQDKVKAMENATLNDFEKKVIFEIVGGAAGINSYYNQLERLRNEMEKPFLNLNPEQEAAWNLLKEETLKEVDAKANIMNMIEKIKRGIYGQY